MGFKGLNGTNVGDLAMAENSFSHHAVKQLLLFI